MIWSFVNFWYEWFTNYFSQNTVVFLLCGNLLALVLGIQPFHTDILDKGDDFFGLYLFFTVLKSVSFKLESIIIHLGKKDTIIYFFPVLIFKKELFVLIEMLLEEVATSHTKQSALIGKLFVLVVKRCWLKLGKYGSSLFLFIRGFINEDDLIGNRGPKYSMNVAFI